MNEIDLVTLLQQGQFDSVYHEAIKVVRADPRNAPAWTALGQALVQKHQGQMARLCFNRALLLDPYALWRDHATQDVASTPRGTGDYAVLDALRVPPTAVTACVLTRDSAATIRDCLRSLRGAVDEVIVVDTGSTDSTVTIAETERASVHHFTWIDDFSAARNFASAQARHDWVIHIDSDEVLERADKENIRIAAALYQNLGLLLWAVQINTHADGTPSLGPAMRFYQRSSGMQWHSPIHEYLATDMRSTLHPPRAVAIQVRLHHSGYDRRTTDISAKMKRNIRLLREAVQREAANPQWWYYLGRELRESGDPHEACNALRRAEATGRDALALRPLLLRELIPSLAETGYITEAEGFAKQFIRECPDYPEAWWYYAQVAERHGDVSLCRDALLQVIVTRTTYRGIAPIAQNIHEQADKWLKRLSSSQMGDASP